MMGVWVGCWRRVLGEKYGESGGEVADITRLAAMSKNTYEKIATLAI
jgi:hypothetical protein